MFKFVLIVMIGSYVQTEAVDTFDTSAQCYQRIEWIMRHDPPIFPETKYACVKVQMFPKAKAI